MTTPYDGTRTGIYAVQIYNDKRIAEAADQTCFITLKKLRFMPEGAVYVVQW